jgi:hypothetical protein
VPHHYWGDEDFDWKALDNAIYQGTRLMKVLGRVGVHSKEKYGTARWSLYLCDGTLHSLTHPGYVYSQYPKWLWSFDIMYRPIRFIAPIIRLWQRLVIKGTFVYLCYKYPHIVKEIVQDAPRELLTKKLAKISGSLWQTTCNSCKKSYTCDNDVCPHCGSKE